MTPRSSIRSAAKTVESRWADIGGLRIHARVTLGPTDSRAPIVVLVHGVGVASPYFVPTMKQLAPHFQVFAIDLPGFGRSDKPPHTLSIAALADALAAWLRVVGLERPIVLGNSVGCQVAVDFAARYPEHLSCLILAGPTMDPAARTAWQQIVRWLRNARSERLSQVPLSVRDYWQCGLRRLIGTFRSALQDRIEEKLPHLRVPTLVVRGGKDPIVPQRWCEEAVRLLPRGRLVVIPGAGHTVNYNSPVELARVVREFAGGRDQQPGQEVPNVAVSEETPRLKAIPVIGRSTRVIADFDSASAMVRATARFLRGKDFPQLGMLPSPLMPLMELVAAALNALPKRGRELFYIYSSGSEAIPPERLETLQAEDISRWVVDQYPRRTYPAAMIGSSNGAAVHLCTALGIPWLPQTVLIPVKHPGIPADEPKQDMEWGREPGGRLLAANPELTLHHMHDANQDRLTIQRLTYFRVKRLRLGEPTSGSCSTRCSRARPSSSWSAACGGRPPASANGTSSSTGLWGVRPRRSTSAAGSGSRTTWDGTARASCGGTRHSRTERARRRSGASSRRCVTMCCGSRRSAAIACGASCLTSQKRSACSWPTFTAGGTGSVGCPATGCWWSRSS
jgi:pimeloyl-ACP methyl ester carboxylesterase